MKGAEAELVRAEYLGRPVVEKRRQAKAYRHPDLDARLRAERTRDEGNLLFAARRAGVPVPVVYDVDRTEATIRMEWVEGRTLKDALGSDPARADRQMQELGAAVARLHAAGIVHGDLTTSNVLVASHGLVLIDFGLGAASLEAESRGVDLHLLEEALEATHENAGALFAAFLRAYGGDPETLARLEAIRQRGRYR